MEDARTYFARVGADLIAHFARLGSKCVELETDERLRIVHDFFRVGEETAYNFNIKETRKKGHDFKDYVCPDTMEFEKDYFKMGNRYGRVLFLREYASYIKDSMVAELTDLNRNLMMSIDIVPVPTDEAVREAESRLLGVETNITNWQRKQNQNNNFSATVPYDMEQQKKEMKEFLDDLTTRDQRMMFAVLTMVHTADSKEQLDNDTEALLTTARKHLCQFAVLKYQQMDGLNTAMPFGTRKIDAFRTLTTESLAVFIPFRVQDIYHENGIYYGQNVISKNMIIADRRQLLNGNSFILGVSGGGKSFAAKGEIENIILSSNADVIIIDPEREYSQLVKALGGEIINISATSPSHINAMDMNKEYGDGANPVILKSEFIMSLCEQLIGGTNLGAKQKSIIDRCTASVYRDYQQRGYTGTVPTLQDFRAELLKQDEPEAREIALAIELFTHGSLNTFAKPTNVDTDNRLICYDILDLGKQLMYETFVRNQIGSKTVSSLKKTDIKRFYNYLADERHLKPATIDNIHTVLHQILDMAVDDDYLRNNPSNNVLKELKQSHCFQTEKRRALTRPEQELFLSYLKNTPSASLWYPIFAVLVGTGLRVGEATGLRWCDIDLDEGIINVNHTLVYYDHRTDGSKRGCYFNINTTKTPAGKRQVPMLDFVKEAFLMEKERQELLDIHCEAVVDGYTDFIFLNRFGQPQHQATLNKAIRRIIRDCNDEQLLKDENAKVLLPHFSCHSLRHTFTTRMCEAGVNVKVIQDTLGHKDISTTLNIYTDVTKELRRSEFEGLDSYFKNEYNKANEVL